MAPFMRILISLQKKYAGMVCVRIKDKQASKQKSHQQEYQVPYRCSQIWSLCLCLWSNIVDKMPWYVCAFLCMLSCFSFDPYICFVFSLFRWHYKQDQRKKKERENATHLRVRCVFHVVDYLCSVWIAFVRFVYVLFCAL